MQARTSVPRYEGVSQTIIGETARCDEFVSLVGICIRVHLCLLPGIIHVPRRVKRGTHMIRPLRNEIQSPYFSQIHVVRISDYVHHHVPIADM